MPVYRILWSPEAIAEGAGPPAEEAATITRSEFEALLRARDAEHTRELAERDRKIAEAERSYRSALRDRELATALAGRPLLPGAAAQLIKLWRDDFEVNDDGVGAATVAARDGRTVAQAVAEWLAGPEYAHFCLPPSRGGTAVPGAHRPAATAPAAPAPRNLGESVVQSWQQDPARLAPGARPAPGWGRRR